ncbi:hypothetical protein AAG906_007509 [Vitis piasezkii]
MMEMLKGVSCFTDAEAPSTKMFDFFPLTKRVSINMGASTGMDDLKDRVAFLLFFLAMLTPSPGIIFERVEADLATAQKAVADEAEILKLAEGEKRAIRAEADQLKGENEVLEAREMEAGFAAQKKELEMEYQRQVDEMYFFGYRCCMKKNGIMHDILSFPSNDEDAIPGGPPC